MLLFLFFFFKQKTAYEMRISDWSSDVCSSDLSWDDHFIVLRSIREEINALNARDRARAMNRLAVRHKAIRKAAADSRPTIYPPGVAAPEPWRPKLSQRA